jgi:alpha-glucosidase (family GH31 glycosyl hydrolase)
VYAGSAENLFIWNDMNEPSVFTGPEITMNKVTLASRPFLFVVVIVVEKEGRGLHVNIRTDS